MHAGRLGDARLGSVGLSVRRKEAFDKVTGAAKYNNDFTVPGLLHAQLVTSPHAHARIAAVDVSDARRVPGVRAVVTGDEVSLLCGEVLEDRPPLARGKVRYFGEPVVLVVADSEEEAMRGCRAVRVAYEPLPVVNSPSAALAPGSPLVHEDLGSYRVAQPPCRPEPGSNVADRAKLRKGDMHRGWAEAEVVVEGRYTLPQLDHAAMETRSARVEILTDGRVLVYCSSQAPFEVQKTLAQYFGLSQGQVIVHTPLLGGAFGGKAVVQLEILAYIASKAVAGRPVKLVNARENDICTSPVAMGLEARVKLGARRDGRLVAAETEYWMDAGAYTDSAPRIARAVASACTGPYDVPNVWCDVLAVYTNHVFTSAFRGFGYMPMTFCVERAMDKLAYTLRMDALDLRRRNAIGPGASTPTQVVLTPHLIGDLGKCIDRVRALIDWDQGVRTVVPGDRGQGTVEPGGRAAGDGQPRLGSHRIRAKGAACFWKTSSSPQNALSGAILTFNADGSVNLSIGAVECGPGTKTTAAQILAERLAMDVEQVHVHMEVNTQLDPEHWKTVASMSTFMVGRAVIEAADDAARQLRHITSIVLRCPPEDLEVGGGRVYLKDDPSMHLDVQDVCHGYKYPDGDSIGGQVIGRGCFIMRHLTPLDEETGKGMPGPSWTVGAQAVEVEFDPRECTYRILRAASVMDAGRVINPKTARGVVMGGMCQGLGYGSRECIAYGEQGEVVSTQFRSYRTMRLGEEPDQYLVEFVETPQANAPYGARPIGEHGIIAAPAALASALATAAEVDICWLPATPESLWRARGGVQA